MLFGTSIIIIILFQELREEKSIIDRWQDHLENLKDAILNLAVRESDAE